MEFDLSRKQQDVYDQVGALGKEKFAKRAADLRRTQAATPRENMRTSSRRGSWGSRSPRTWRDAGSGAMGRDPLLYLIAVEQTARYCLSTSHCLHIHCHGCASRRPGRARRSSASGSSAR